MPRRVLLVALVAVIAVGLVWFNAQDDGGRRRADVAPQVPSGASEAIEPPAAQSELEAPGRVEGPRAALEEGVARAGEASPSAPPPEVIAAVDGEVCVTLEAPHPLGARALLLPGTRPFMSGDTGAAAEDEAAWSPLERTGPRTASVTFANVGLGSWSVALATPTRDLRWSVIHLKGAEARADVRFVLGEAALYGTVWDGAGTPVEGARISVSLDGGAGPVRAETVTSADGRYRLAGLDHGYGWFEATRRPGAGASPEELASEALALEEREERRMDVGSPAGTARVRVCIADVLGGAAWEGSLEALPQTDSGTETRGDVDDQGCCELPLTAGEWLFRYWGPDGSHIWQTTLEVVGAGEFEHRLVLPGALVYGRFLPRGEAEDGARFAGAGVALRASRDAAGRIVHSTKARTDGRFRFDGVAPGTYYLTVSNALGGGITEVVVLESAVDVRVDVPVTR